MKFTITKSCLERFSGIFVLGTPSNIHGTAISYRCAKFGAFVNSVTILTLIKRPDYMWIATCLLENPDSKSGKFACEIQNPGLWNPEYSSRITESNLRLESGIQISLNRIRKFGIHGVESRTQECLEMTLTWSGVESSHKQSGLRDHWPVKFFYFGVLYSGTRKKNSLKNSLYKENFFYI